MGKWRQLTLASILMFWYFYFVCPRNYVHNKITILRWVEIHVVFVIGWALTISIEHEFWLLVAGTVYLC